MKPERVRASVPPGTFLGTNFLTPHPLEFWKLLVRGRLAYAEIAEGTGLDREAIFGVTFRRVGGGELWREEGGDPSKLCHSLEEARAYLEEVSDAEV